MAEMPVSPLSTYNAKVKKGRILHDPLEPLHTAQPMNEGAVVYGGVTLALSADYLCKVP